MSVTFSQSEASRVIRTTMLTSRPNERGSRYRVVVSLVALSCLGCARGNRGASSLQHSEIKTPSSASIAHVKPKAGEEADGLALRALVDAPLSWREPNASLTSLRRIKVLGFNDLHGQLLGRSLEGRPVGGAAVLAAYFKQAARGFEGSTIIAHGGDMLGASPPYAALYQDEPTVNFVNLLGNAACSSTNRANPDCNLVAVVGNHEFDEGAEEALRMLRGGDHARGPFLGASYRGPSFPILGANVIDVSSGRPVAPAYVVKVVAGVRVGFVGVMLRDAGKFLIASGVRSLRFEDEAEHVNRGVAELKAQGVRAVVVLIHQGGNQAFAKDLPRDQSAVSGAIAEIVPRFDAEVDLVIAGHSHSPLLALLPNAGGRPTLVTEAFHSTTAFADVSLDVEPSTGDVVQKSARLVTTFGDAGPGLAADPGVAKFVEGVVASVRDRTERVVGEAAHSVTRKLDPSGQSAIGNLVADAQRAALGTDLAFTTPAWLRADLLPGKITWGDLFAVQPFGNRLMRLQLSGSEVIELLNQQWIDESYNRMLAVSGLSYTWDIHRPSGARVFDVTVGEEPIEANRSYGAAVNEFLAEGGELFGVLGQLPRKESGIGDLEALVRWVELQPKLNVTPDSRIVCSTVP